jgi:hypothetical protein
LRWLLLKQINSEDSRRDCIYYNTKAAAQQRLECRPRHKDLGVFAALGAYHFFLHTGDQNRKTTRE